MDKQRNGDNQRHVDNQPAHPDADDREVDFAADEPQILPDQTRDDTDRGWGERRRDDSNDERLLAERPPHWD